MKIKESELRKIIAEAIIKEIYTWNDGSSQKQTGPGYTTVYKMKWDYRFLYGMFRGKRVDDVYNSGMRGREYIGWMYYNMAMIDFADEIKEKLSITPIEKPGVDKEAFKEWREKFDGIDNMSDEEKRRREILVMANASHRKKVARDKAAAWKEKSDARGEWRDDKISNPGRLQQANHGHIKFVVEN